MGIAQDWKAARTACENLTKSRKPGDKFHGVFQKPSGIEGACEKFDAAVAKGTLGQG